MSLVHAVGQENYQKHNKTINAETKIQMSFMDDCNINTVISSNLIICYTYGIEMK